VLEVDEGSAPAPAKLVGRATPVGPHTWRLTITNTGAGPANDVRLTGVDWQGLGNATPPVVSGRDPNAFPVPVAASLAPGESATTQLAVESHDARPVLVEFSANGGRARGLTAALP